MENFEIDIYNQYQLPEGKKTSTCPKCSHTRKKNKEKCLMLDWKKGLGTCQHCGAVIQLHTYKNKGSRDTKKEYKLPEQPKAFTLSDKVLEYFKGRGISERALSVAKVSEGFEWMPQFRDKNKVNTIQFNYYENGTLVNTKFRGPKKAFKLVSGAKLVLSGIDRWKDEKEVVIVEGEIDELSFIEAGINNVASVPNGATLGNINLDYLDNCIDYFENKEKIIIAVDNDEAGKNLERELVRRLGSERCYIANLGALKDANELLLQNGAKSLRELYFSAKPCPLENVATYQDEQEEYYNFLINGIENGYNIGLPCFDSNFSVYINQPILVTGIPSHGKSDFVDMMCLGYAKEHGLKVAYASPENKPNYLHIHKLVAKVYGKFPSKNDIDNPIFKACEEFVNDNINFIDYKHGYYLDDVLAKGAELVKRKGIKVLVIDPFNKVVMKDRRRDEDSYVPDYLFKLQEFSTKYDVLPILVAHPTKMKTIKGENKPPIPTMYDVRGTGDFYDMMPHGLCVYRDFETNLSIVKTLKVKFSFQGTTGIESLSAWNPDNGRYSPVEGDLEEGNVFPVFDNTPWILPEKYVEPKQIDDEKANYSQEEVPF